jgi:hypothetical protein
MDWQELFNGFQLHSDLAINQQIDSVSAIKMKTLIVNWKPDLCLERNAPQRKLTAHACMVGRFKQSRPQFFVYIDCCCNYLFSHFGVEQTTSLIDPVSLLHITVHGNLTLQHCDSILFPP